MSIAINVHMPISKNLSVSTHCLCEALLVWPNNSSTHWHWKESLKVILYSLMCFFHALYMDFGIDVVKYLLSILKEGWDKKGSSPYHEAGWVCT